MPAPNTWRGVVWELGAKRPTARVTDEDGNVLVQSDFEANVPLTVYDISSNNVVLFSTNRAVGGVFFNSLQTWDEDSTGYNFQDTIGTNVVVLEGGKKVRVEYRPVHTTLGTIPIVFEWRVETMISG